ncbi:MAG: thioredoxin domain-containing protein, partial [Amphiplicatus sp.]
MIKRSRLFLVFALLAGGAVLFQALSKPGAVSAAFNGEPELIAATFSSEWCASCRVLKPNLAQVLPKFASKPVRFVEYDFTFGQTDA